MPDQSDEKVVNAEKARAGRTRQWRMIHWRRLMADEDGRDFVWDLLSRGNIFSSSYRTDAYATAFNEGARALMLPIFFEIVEADPANYTLMTVEHSNTEMPDGGRIE